MKKLIACLAAAILLAYGSASVAVTSTEADKIIAIKKIPADEKKISFMLMVSANKGSLTPEKGNEYMLKLKKSDLNKIVVFSERPNRIVKIISGKLLKSIWKDGANSFEMDPPNATIMAAGIKQTVVKLTEMTAKNGFISFKLKPIKGGELLKQGNQLKDITLVIDSVSTMKPECVAICVSSVVTIIPGIFACAICQM